jgi:hypothetical protein
MSLPKQPVSRRNGPLLAILPQAIENDQTTRLMGVLVRDRVVEVGLGEGRFR